MYVNQIALDAENDVDGDGVCADVDVCPQDPLKSQDDGICGCGNAEVDSDGDGFVDCGIPNEHVSPDTLLEEAPKVKRITPQTDDNLYNVVIYLKDFDGISLPTTSARSKFRYLYRVKITVKKGEKVVKNFWKSSLRRRIKIKNLSKRQSLTVKYKIIIQKLTKRGKYKRIAETGLSPETEIRIEDYVEQNNG